MTLIGKWLAARWQWLRCAAYGHPLTTPQRIRYNNRHGQEDHRDEWCECPCGSRKGPTARVRIMRPHQESL